MPGSENWQTSLYLEQNHSFKANKVETTNSQVSMSLQHLELHVSFTLEVPNMEIHVVELANRVDPDEVAHYEPPHLDLHCLASGL